MTSCVVQLHDPHIRTHFDLQVQHVLHAHNDGSDVDLHLLTESERAAIGATGTTVGLMRERMGSATNLMVKAFACCHCSESLMPRYLPGEYQYMSLDDVRLHSKQRCVQCGRRSLLSSHDHVGYQP